MTEKRDPYLVQVPGRSTWYIRDGDKRVSTRTSDVTHAAEVLADYRAKQNGEQVRNGKRGLKTLSELLKFWEKQHRSKDGGDASWGQKWRYVVGVLERHAGQRALATLDLEWSQSYARGRRAEGVQDPSIRQELALVLAAWRAAAAVRLVTMDPPAFSMPSPSEARDVFLTKPQAKKLIAACKKPHLRLFVELALATSARPGAVLALQWRHVYLETGRVDYRASGQKRRVTEGAETRANGKKAALVPINAKMVSKLREARAVAQTDYVIEFTGRPVASVKKSFRAAVEAAGLDPEEITPHVLRHTAATWMAQRGVPMWEIAGHMGHSSVKMVEKVYGHHSPEFMKRGQDALDLDEE